jgi:YebC/PmpR family DNA-binding regulatory protein
MSGHSKWANIKHRKAAVDTKRGKVFSRLGREIMMAARRGGPNPDINFRLKLAVQKARANNLPMDNINRAIQRGGGEGAQENIEEFTYEGYGPGGVAILLDIVTDNRNRTASDVRHLFSRHGGNLGESGCVAWMFDKRGTLTINAADTKKSEDDLMMVALEAGADDLRREDDTYTVVTAPERLEVVREAFVAAGVGKLEAEITMIPKSTVTIEGADAEKLMRLMEALEDHEDVQNLYANFDIPDEVLAKLEA